MNELDRLNRRIDKLTQKKDELLKQLRKKCKHLRLIEIEYSYLYCGAPPFRICADCGAEERGWRCGYMVLVLKNEGTNIPHGVKRAIIKTTRSYKTFCSYRKEGPLYEVGQSHPNFQKGGFKTYKQLTAT